MRRPGDLWVECYIDGAPVDMVAQSPEEARRHADVALRSGAGAAAICVQTYLSRRVVEVACPLERSHLDYLWIQWLTQSGAFAPKASSVRAAPRRRWRPFRKGWWWSIYGDLDDLVDATRRHRLVLEAAE